LFHAGALFAAAHGAVRHVRDTSETRPRHVPQALFATAHDDVLVRPHHSRLIFDAFAGGKTSVGGRSRGCL